MPRQSTAALSVVAFEPREQRPEPPKNLSKDAAVQWREIVNSMPPDWFPRATHPMLTQLCRQIVRCAGIADALDKAEKDGVDLSLRAYQNLIRAEMQLSASIAHLSTKMRISQQSSAKHDKNRKRIGQKSVPWENIQQDGEDEEEDFERQSQH